MAVFTVTAPDGNEYEVNAPEGATEDQALAYARQQWEAGSLVPAAPSPAAGPMEEFDLTTETPMGSFNRRAKAFDEAITRWTATTGGVLRKPGQNVRQATAEWAGIPDPEPERSMAEIEELAQGGELQYGGSVPYAASKTLASMGGFALGGPFGATGAEALVRQTALAYNLKKAIDAGAVTEDRAAEIFAKEMSSGTAEDLAWNSAVPMLGQILKRVPGVRGLVAKVASKLRPAGAPAPVDDLAAQRAAKTAADVKLTKTPAAKQAVEDLSARVEPLSLTPGQITGEAGLLERTARVAGKPAFAAQEKAVQTAAEGMREAALAPAGQPTREAIGETVQRIAEETQKATKLRLRPVFKAADDLGVKVDFDDVLARAKAALAADAAVPGGRLLPAERSDLGNLVKQLEATSGKGVSAEAALDFISRQKEKIRAVTADYKPSKFYETIVGGFTKSADEAFTAAAAKAGKPSTAAALKAAQGEYRVMMETVYDDAVKQALKKNPEDVGRLFWQAGNVSEIKQVQKLMALAQREGKMTAAGAEELSRAMTRGFLQEAVPNIDTAAKWSTMLREKPGLRDTWTTLTSALGGKELRSAMEVLEEASKMAVRGSAAVSGVGAVPLRRAEGLGLGVSYVTGTIHPGMLATGLAVLPLTRMMATAYTQGNKGVLNMIARVLRAQSAGTAAGAKAMQAALPVLEEYAAEHGITDLFLGSAPRAQGQASEPDPTQGVR